MIIKIKIAYNELDLRRRSDESRSGYTWVVIGGIAGLLAEILVKGIKVGLVGTVMIGILGALIGGWLFGVLKITIATGLLGEVIAAVVGAVILLILLRSLRHL